MLMVDDEWSERHQLAEAAKSMTGSELDFAAKSEEGALE